MSNEQYVNFLINDGVPVPPEDRVPILVGTLSVLELVPRQANVPEPQTGVVGRPVLRSVPAKPGLVSRIIGPRTKQVVAIQNTREVTGASVANRKMVLYQPVIGPGRKRALVVGCNYIDSPKGGDVLQNACNDARHISMWLQKTGFNDIITMVDDDRAAVYPSRENMLKGMKWLVDGVRAGDNLFFFFSGHGDWKLDYSGDEADDHDECIVPADYYTLAHPTDAKAGYLVDDELFQVLVRDLPKGAMLHAVFDACHSGSALDLPYIHNHRGQCVASGFAVGTHKDLFALNGDVIMLSAARDTPAAPDRAKLGTVKLGLLTYAFLNVMEKLQHPSATTYSDLLTNVQTALLRAYPPTHLADRAIPIISSSKPYDLDHPIVM